MAVDRVDHFGLTVADIEEAVAFYRDVIGCNVISRLEPGTDEEVRRLVGVPDADIRGAMLRTPGGDQIELVMYTHPQMPPQVVQTTTPSAVHIALRVTQFDDVLRRLKESGAQQVSEPVRFGDARFAFSRDPFGVLLELIESPGQG